jgi:serine O-acetyltransferase
MAVTISSKLPDWSREKIIKGEWSPTKNLFSSIRLYQYHTNKLTGMFYFYHKLQVWGSILKHRFWSIVTAADIPINSHLGGGLLLPHGSGVVINPNAIIGVNCLFMSQVVVNTRGRKGSPVIGGHVDIGTGAKILGDIVIGDHVQVGANAVVLTDIPPYSIAVGIPARVISTLNREVGV